MHGHHDEAEMEAHFQRMHRDGDGGNDSYCHMAVSVDFPIHDDHDDVDFGGGSDSEGTLHDDGDRIDHHDDDDYDGGDASKFLLK